MRRKIIADLFPLAAFRAVLPTEGRSQVLLPVFEA
jgi:hypothetical protein